MRGGKWRPGIQTMNSKGYPNPADVLTGAQVARARVQRSRWRLAGSCYALWRRRGMDVRALVLVCFGSSAATSPSMRADSDGRQKGYAREVLIDDVVEDKPGRASGSQTCSIAPRAPTSLHRSPK